jgi:S-formylglutathione hydrolase FrmB
MLQDGPVRLAAGLVVVALVAAGCGGQPQPVRTGDAEARGARVERYVINSAAVGTDLRQVAIRPAGGGRRPLLVVLHGRGGRREEANAVAPFFEALAALGDRAPAVVMPAGGEASYWHDRSTGDWSRYVLDEVVPEAVERLDADPSRLAISGISMGGFGAFDIARQAPERFCAVAGLSSALWLDGESSAEGAFDDAEDFAEHDVIALARQAGRGPWGAAGLWLGIGTEDPFLDANVALAEALGSRLRRWPGGHEQAVWSRAYPDLLAFAADTLASCRRPAAARRRP